jgi:DNA-binding CsgD family transcriptional regulator
MAAESPISEREREILRLVAEGATNQQIAQQLDISVNTVKVHLRNIFGKIGVASRTEATVYAIRQGLVVVEGRPAEPITLVAEPVVAVEEPPVLAVQPASLEPEPTPFPPQVEERVVAPPVKRRFSPALLAAVALGLVVLAGVSLLLWRPAAAPDATPSAAAPPVSQAERWQARAPLPTPRTDFALATNDGRLFVIGGQVAGAPSAAVDRYDPANDVWVTLNDKPNPVTHVLAAAVGGVIYVPGGEGPGGEVRDVLDAYNPRTQQWETLAQLPAPRSRYALVPLEGRLYLFGGWDGTRYCDEVFIFDPATGAWSEDDSVPTARRGQGAAVVEGRIYVIGGENERGPLRVNERYDPTADAGQRWESAAPPGEPLATPAVVGTLDVVLAFDPAQPQVLQYSPATDNWQQGDLPAGISVSSRAVFLGTSVYVFGDPARGELSEYRALFNTFLPGTTSE